MKKTITDISNYTSVVSNLIIIIRSHVNLYWQYRILNCDGTYYLRLV